MHLWMSTKRCRHGQGVTVWKWLNFGVDPDQDVDIGSLFLTLQDWAFYTLSLTRG